MALRATRTRREKKDIITWRGHEVTRIEAFSDAVFGFAITLLVVSLEVPKTYDELILNLSGFIPFSICFTLFFQIWVTQNLFFRRYGMHDEFTLFLNAALLFMVLFFVYPLKFLWNLIVFQNSSLNDTAQLVHLFYIYSGGYTAIYLLFALMYWHAKRRREYLKLTDIEVFETQTYVYRNFGMAMVGVVSIIIASLGPAFLNFAGISYTLIAFVVWTIHSKRKKIYDKKRKRDNHVKREVSNEPSGEKIAE